MLSVIICTHNPRETNLRRTLAALANQTLPTADWELIVIDNASETSVASRFDLKWHPNAHHIHEEKLGLNLARLRGIEEASGDLLLFVDDDNLLEADYLVNVRRISEERPYLGAWGGIVTGEFETPPPDWIREYLPMLALRDAERDCWGNSYSDSNSLPVGAGLCVRRAVANFWSEKLQTDARRLRLDRKGADLAADGDLDLAMTASDMGLASGVFCDLKLIHLIGKQRLTLGYVVRLAEAISRTHVLLESVRNSHLQRYRPSRAERWYTKYRLWRMPREKGLIETAMIRGREAGYRELGL